MTSFDAGLRELIAEVVREELAKLAESAKPREFLSTAEASAVARVAQGTIRRWIREGKIEPHRAGRELRVLRSELEALMRDAGRRQARDLSPEALADRDSR